MLYMWTALLATQATKIHTYTCSGHCCTSLIQLPQVVQPVSQPGLLVYANPRSICSWDSFLWTKLRDRTTFPELGESTDETECLRGDPVYDGGMRYSLSVGSPFSNNIVRSRPFHMKVVRNVGEGGQGITLLPKSETYSKALFWFHGLGDTADGWAQHMSSLGLTDTKIILPNAPNRPISLNGGHRMPGWSDIIGLDMSTEEDRKGLDDSAIRVKSMIEAEISGGISADRIVVGGFSQGGALALHLGLRSSHKLAGCVAFSAWVPLHKDYPQALSETSKSLPILQAHGDDDRVVSIQWGSKSHELLAQIIEQPAPQFLVIEGLGHSSDSEEMEALKSFLATVVTS